MMFQEPAASAAPSATTTASNTGSMSFGAQDPNAMPPPNHELGETLLVSAYAIIWLILMASIALLWRKQSRINARLDDLERELDKHDAAQAAKKPAKG